MWAWTERHEDSGARELATKNNRHTEIQISPEPTDRTVDNHQ